MKDIDEMNKELQTQLSSKEDYWNKTIKELSVRLKCSVNEVVDLQADVLSQKQILSDEIKYITYELYQFLPILKSLRKKKLEFYLTKYPIKVQGPDRLKLIESDISMYDLRKDMYDIHIDFLKDSLKNMEQINYGIKNKITLYELIGLE